MEHRILIVDDDQIFNSLLSDVFMQAGYTVQSAFSGDEAMGLLDKGEYHLVVTDQRMPGTPGTHLVRHIMKEHKGLAVVMVSGYLSNDDIRQLIRDGVGGVFIKPLNIFQLLKRAAQLIEKRGNAPVSTGLDGEKAAVAPPSQDMKSFRGARSPLAVRFLKQLQNLHSFTSNLLLLGNQGSCFDAICEDLAGTLTDSLFFLSSEDLDDPIRLAARLGGLATQDSGRQTLVLKHVEQLGPERAETIFSIARAKAPFDKLGQSTRFIFCLRDNPDDMFDAGKIDENLYLFMGTMEMKVPAISELREDFPAMAHAILEHRMPSPCRLDDEAVALLKRLDWPGDAVQFEQVLAAAAAFTSGPIVSANALRDAYEGKKTSVAARSGGLREHLLIARDEYVSAMIELYGNNRDAAAHALGISTSALTDLMRSA